MERGRESFGVHWGDRAFRYTGGRRGRESFEVHWAERTLGYTGGEIAVEYTGGRESFGYTGREKGGKSATEANQNVRMGRNLYNYKITCTHGTMHSNFQAN